MSRDCWCRFGGPVGGGKQEWFWLCVASAMHQLMNPSFHRSVVWLTEPEVKHIHTNEFQVGFPLQRC